LISGVAPSLAGLTKYDWSTGVSEVSALPAISGLAAADPFELAELFGEYASEISGNSAE
jgi:hypothetical protein